MSNSENQRDKISASRRPESALNKEIIEDRLHEVGVRVARSTTVEEGIKACYETGHTNPANQTLPGLIDGNHAIHGGDGLVIFDIDVDDLSELPDWVRDLPDTFTIESPHEGYHRYYTVDDDAGLSTTKTGWGSIRCDGGYVVGPDSTIDHAQCPVGKRNCPGEGVGTYDISADRSIATLSGEHFKNLRDAYSESNDAEEFDADVIENPDNDLIALGEQALHDLQAESTPAFHAVMDFLQGGTADFEGEILTKDNGLIDRDTHDTLAFSLLNGTLRELGGYDHSEVIEIATATYTHYCQELSQTEDNQTRRWLTDGEDYRRRIITYATNSYDPHQFTLLLEKKGASLRRENNEYSELTYDAIWTALYDQLPSFPPILSNDMDPGNPATEEPETGGGPMVEKPQVHELYPGKDEVIDQAYQNDDGYNSRKSYEEAFRRLQADYGEVKAARIGSSTWVYYPAEYPDPPEACSVRQYGEKYDPEVADEINSWTGEPETSEASETDEIMTDGGTQMEISEAKRDIERVRQVREESTEPTEEPELYRCPIEGCTRTVIDDPSNLRSHVRQAGDDAHRHRTLAENLEIEVHWEQMDWGPGAPKSEG